MIDGNQMLMNAATTVPAPGCEIPPRRCVDGLAVKPALGTAVVVFRVSSSRALITAGSAGTCSYDMTGSQPTSVAPRISPTSRLVSVGCANSRFAIASMAQAFGLSRSRVYWRSRVFSRASSVTDRSSSAASARSCSLSAV